MRFQRRARILLLTLLWQALACLLPQQIDTQQAVVDQLIVHALQAGDHHHHGDPSLQLDGGANEAAHEHLNPGAQPPALVPAMAGVPSIDTPAVFVASVGAGHAPVFPQRPLRPPRRLTTPA